MQAMRVGVAVLVAVVGACDAGGIQSNLRKPCADSSECENNFECSNGVCLQTCLASSQCFQQNQACVAGFCETILNPACFTDDDCTDENLCQRVDTGRCVEGQCNYTPVLCEQPQPYDCNGADDTLTGFLPLGTCQEVTGDCLYDAANIACPSCTTSCLGAASCTLNSECSPLPCIQGTCSPPSGFRDPCDNGDSGDCDVGLICREGLCLKRVQEQCVTNAECDETCRDLACASISPAGGPCDDFDDEDCRFPLSCLGDACGMP